jgi:uncharacterized protein (TIGR02145 family)
MKTIMKTIMKTTIMLLLLVSSGVYGQRGIGTNTPDKSAILELASTSKGFLPPRMTTAERDVINSGVWAEGLTIYNTDTKCLELYNGTVWTAWTAVVDSFGYGQCRVKVSPTAYKTFLCHNLGADTSTDPHTPQIGNQGAYIQWGKKGPSVANEDVRVTWLTAADNGSLGFASAPTVGSATPGSWAAAEINDDAWNVDENNPTKIPATDPCPDGYRVPTRAEWTAVNTNNTVSRTGTFTISATNYGAALHYGPDASTKLLTLPAAGFRGNPNGPLYLRGYLGFYWSSTENVSNAYSLYFYSSNVNPAINPADSKVRTNGFSVRCIAE